MARKYRQGKYTPKNPQKYVGDATKIIFRSSWERAIMVFFDTSNSVTKWGSEELVIPYLYELDGKTHRYFTDFMVEIIDTSGKKQKYIIEVKPFIETQQPIRGKQKEATYLKQVETYVKNKNKWTAAEAFCAKNGLKFKILTEREIFGENTKKGRRKKS